MARSDGKKGGGKRIGKKPEPLVLKKGDLRKNTAALFEKLESDEKLRDRFIQNPVQMLSERVFKQKVPRQTVSESNRFLFSILANERFLDWLAKWKAENRDRKLEKNEFNRAIAGALIEFGDENLGASVVASNLAGVRLFGANETQCVCNNPAGTATCTPVDTPSSAKSSSNHDGFGFGDPRDVDPQLVRAITDQLIERAKQLSEEGALADMQQVII